MLISLAGLVKRGEIDNTQAGSIKLTLWGADGTRPIHASMLGDCSPDIAGCMVRFENLCFDDQKADPWEFMLNLASGCEEWFSGDMTLSCRRRESNNRAYWTNCMVLEFFAGVQARLVLDTELFNYEISVPQWEADEATANLQYLLSMDNMRAHIAHSLKANQYAQEKLVDKEFPRCEWDSILNRAETSVNIANSLRGKYADSFSELASMAYIFDLPETLNLLAREDEGADSPMGMVEVTTELGLFDYLPTKQADLIKEAMAHPLFTCTSQMTDLIFSSLNRAHDCHIYTAEQVNSIRLSYAAIVSRILASILLVQQGRDYSLKMVQRRIKHMQQSLRGLLNAMPTKKPELDELKDAARALITSLDDFSRELSHH